MGDNNIKAMAIVKSEDGMLDVIPDLHPKIRRSEVRNAFQILQALAAQKEPDSEELSRIVEWLYQHEFYLTEAECKKANELHEQAREKRDRRGIYQWPAQPLKPHPLMNDSYFLD